MYRVRPPRPKTEHRWARDAPPNIVYFEMNKADAGSRSVGPCRALKKVCDTMDFANFPGTSFGLLALYGKRGKAVYQQPPVLSGTAIFMPHKGFS